jgi:glycosyltransferase involved in cell wall biosynthesis
VTFKQCWQDDRGRWVSYGGFPSQMEALAGLFDRMTLVIVRGRPQGRGMPLPERATIVPLRSPTGVDFRRKCSVAAHLGYYLKAIAGEVGQADVIHTPVPGDIPLLGMAVALVKRKRLVGLYNGSWEPNSQTTVMNRVTRSCMRAFAGGRNVMLAVGDGDTPPARGINWVFATALSEQEVAGIRVDLNRGLSSPPRMIYAGRLSVEKGVPNLVRALAVLRQEGFQPLPHCTLAGDGPQRAEIEALIHTLGCEEHITLTGQLERPALSEMLSKADFCVHPSFTEGYCKAWLDAMAHGLPILSTEVGAARAVVGTRGLRGWLVPPGDVPAFAAALREVLSGSVDWAPLRRRCHAYAAARTLERWAATIGEACARQWGAGSGNGRRSS